MPVTDPIADFLTRIRNAVAVGHPEVDMPYSKMKVAIATILKDEGYIRTFLTVEDGHKQLRIILKYGNDQEAVIRGLKRESRPGLRRYVGHDSIPRVLGGMGLAVVSTSRGVMSGRQAKRSNLGGELLCSIW